MRPTQIASALNILIEAQQPVMIHGSPGVGKSDIVRQVAENNKLEVLDIRLSQMDPVDLRGVPSIDTKNRRTLWNSPGFLPTSGRGIVFFDEINSAAQATQAAAYQLILDRRLGEYVLPEGWTMIAAGNRTTDRAIVNQMSTALKNRFVHLDYEVNNDDWCMWALNNNVCVEVLGFIRFRPTLLNEFEARNESKEENARIQRLRNTNAFATPRSWSFLSKVVDKKPAPELEYELYSGIVGEGPATEFMGYLKYYRDLPNLDALLLNPNGTKVPEEPATLYALATGLASKATVGNMENIAVYADRMPVEFQVLLFKDTITRNREIANTKAFNNWATKNQEVLF